MNRKAGRCPEPPPERCPSSVTCNASIAWRLRFLADRALWAGRIQALYQEALAYQASDRNRAVGALRSILGLLTQGRAWSVELRVMRAPGLRGYVSGTISSPVRTTPSTRTAP